MKEFQSGDGFARIAGMRRADVAAIRRKLKRAIKQTDEEIADIQRQIATFERLMAERGREVDGQAG